MSKEILYSYVKPINKNYVKKIAIQANRSTSEFIDSVLDSLRMEKPLVFEQKKLKSVEKVKKLKQKKKNQLKYLKVKAAKLD